MLSRRALIGMRCLGSRNIGISAVTFQKAMDPIQQLFVDKIKEYSSKAKSSGGKLVDSTPVLERQLQQELDKAAKQFGAKGKEDMTKFPTFTFTEPSIEKRS